jgi:hypothetical protein
MSPLEAARRLAEGSGDPCAFCLHWPESGGGPHADGCPMLGMPSIVAVLEAAAFVNEVYDTATVGNTFPLYAALQALSGAFDAASEGDQN